MPTHHATDSLRAFLADAGRTFVPANGDRHGPLPPLLVVLTAVTGIVDAVSYLRLDHVFVANMTGNVVFLGFGIAGAPQLSIASSLVAIAAFLLGAAGAGRLLSIRLPGDRGRMITWCAGGEAVLIAGALAMAATEPVTASSRHYVLIVLLAVAMAVQNAAALKLAVPDLRTTVLTLTLAGLAADIGAGAPARAGRRIVAVGTMFVGALVGGALTLRINVAAALALALALTATTAVAAHLLSRSLPPWSAPVS